MLATAFSATLATPQSAAATAGCDGAWQDEIRSIIHSLPTCPATLATPQSAAVIAGCDSLRDSYASRTSEDERMRSRLTK